MTERRIPVAEDCYLLESVFVLEQLLESLNIGDATVKVIPRVPVIVDADK
jgi:hypothetical protein